jgi:hypothetical protein
MKLPEAEWTKDGESGCGLVAVATVILSATGVVATFWLAPNLLEVLWS